MLCLGFERRAAGWQAQTDPLIHLSCLRFDMVRMPVCQILTKFNHFQSKGKLPNTFYCPYNNQKDDLFDSNCIFKCGFQHKTQVFKGPLFVNFRSFQTQFLPKKLSTSAGFELGSSEQKASTLILDHHHGPNTGIITKW